MTNDMLDGAVAKSVAEKLIGLDVSEANKLCADSKCIVRVSCIAQCASSNDLRL